MAPTLAPTAAPGGSIYFNGTPQRLTYPSNQAFAFGTGDFTVEVWTYPITLRASQIVGCHTYGVTNEWIIGLGSDGKVYFMLSCCLPADTLYSSSTAALNTWTHVAVARQNGVVTMYLNGAAEGSKTNSYAVGAKAALGIGSSHTGATSDFFKGYITNVRIIKGTALYKASFESPAQRLEALPNTVFLLHARNTNAQDAIVDSSINAFVLTNYGATFADFSPFT